MEVARDAIAEHSPGSPCDAPYCTRIPDQPAAPGPAEISYTPVKSALQSCVVTFTQCAFQTGSACQSVAKRANGFPALVYHPPRA
jgi:hypothetical protein